MAKHDMISDPRCKLIYHFPFFGSLSLYLIPREDKKIPTAATDGRYLYYNPEWFGGLSEDQQMAVIAHEVMHPALGHVYQWRRGNRHPMVWNVAGDYLINQLLADSKIKLWAEPKPLLDSKYIGMSTEEIYATFERPDPNCPHCGGKGFVPSGAPGDGEGESEEGEGGDQEGEGGGDQNKYKPCPECGKGCGFPSDMSFDIIEDCEGTTDEEQKKARQWTDRLISAAQTAKQRGTLPAGMDRILDELINPKLPWTSLLSQLVAEATRDDYSDLRYDRRMLQYGIYLPDVYQEKIYAAVAVDTSGSMSKEEITEALSESWGILHCRNVTRIRLLSCDAGVHFDQEYHPSDPCPTSVPGGGGTDFAPVFERLAEGRDVPACLIYFTDLEGSFPEEKPNYPVFWVTKTTRQQALDSVPFGRVLKYES